MKGNKRLESAWDYLVSLYEKEGVAEACLWLQDRHGADVMLLLFFCWIWREKGIAPGENHIRYLVECSTDWQREVISAIRKIRRQIGQTDDLSQRRIYRSLKASEMDAERQELLILSGALGELSDQVIAEGASGDLAAALARYFEVLEISLNRDDRKRLAHVARAAA